MIVAAVRALDPVVDFSRFDRNGDGVVDAVILVHSGVGAEAASGDRTQFWSITSSLSSDWHGAAPCVTEDPRPGHPGEFMFVDRFSVVPELSPIHSGAFTEIGVYCHEFGHAAFGWPDLYDATQLGGGLRLGPGNWCLMATGAYGGDSRTPERPTHPCAWAKLDAGWVTVENLVSDGDRSFPPVENSHTAYRLWFQGEASDEYFLLENRQRLGFDAALPGHGLMVYRVRDDVIATARRINRVNSGFDMGLVVEEADGFYNLMQSVNRGDGRDPFPGTTGATRFADDTVPSTRTHKGQPLNTSLLGLREIGSDVRAYVQLFPPGWGAPVEIGSLGSGGGLAASAADVLAVDPTGDLWFVYHDDTATGPEVFARRKRYGIEWSLPIQITSEPGVSLDPSLAIDAQGRKAVAWWDTRDGNSEIYYAWAPAGSTFGPARRVTTQASPSQLPSIAWMPDGRLLLVWMDGRDGGTSIYCRRFLPNQEAFAADVRVSALDPFQLFQASSLPSAVVLANGNTLIAYQERPEGVDEIFVVRDSGAVFTKPRLMSQRDGFTSNQPTLVAESDTSALLFWRENLPVRTQVREIRWTPVKSWGDGSSSITYENSDGVAFPRGLADAQGNLNLFFERSGSNGGALAYMTWHRTGNVWDAGAARFGATGFDPFLGSASVFDLYGRLHVVWAGAKGGDRRLWEVVRAAPAQGPVAVDPAPARGEGELRASPNPARGRASILVRTHGSRPPSSQVVVYTVTGRRVRSFPVAGDRDVTVVWDGRDANGARVPPGVLVLRLEGSAAPPVAAKLVWLP